MWFVIRFEMTVTCMVIRRTGGVTECMRIAWRASKGNVWRLFCNSFVLSLPLIAAQALLIGYQTYLMLTGQMLNTVGSLLLDAASIMLTALLSGYVYLSIHPLHEQLLENYFAANPEIAPIGLPSSNEVEEYEDIPEEENEN